MHFADRHDAGRRLAAALGKHKWDKDVVVIALPRGGVVLGRVVADALGRPLDIVVPRKIGSEANAEYAIGALTEGGHAVWNEDERRKEDPGYLEYVVAKEKAEAQRRLERYRAGMPPRRLKGRTAVIVDDGIATGYTMRAAIATVRAEGASRVVVAVPVAPPESVSVLEKEADEVIVLEEPSPFFAIGAFYALFDQVGDDEVVALLRR